MPDSLTLPNPNPVSNCAMAKTIDSISEAIRNSKHPFRQTETRPNKASKHRYERRKVREYIKLGGSEFSEQPA